MIDSVLVGNVAGALLTIMGFSFLYRQNMFYRLMEHLFVGIALGYSLSISTDNIIRIGLTPFVRGSYDYIFPIFLGLLLFTGLSRKYSRARVVTSAIVAGIGTGLVLRGIVGAQILGQIVGMPPIVGKDLISTVSGIIFFVSMTTSLVYFLFIRPERGIIARLQRPIERTGQIGRYFIMVGLGATLGSTVLSNSSFIVERVQFLVLTPVIGYIVAPAAIVAMVLIWRDINQTKKP